MAHPLTMCIFSDLHFMAWKDTNQPVEWVPSLIDALADANNLSPDTIVFNGDLTNGKERDYQLAIESIENHIARSVPTYFTMGNHEYYGYYEDDNYSFRLAQRRFLRFTRQEAIFYEIRRPECTMIFLSPEEYLPDQHGDAAWISETQLAWFEHRLHTSPQHLPVFIFLHQPINDTVANSTGYVVQSSEIREILGHRPGCFVVSGHTHCPMDRANQLVSQNGTLFVGGGCVCNNTPQSRWVTITQDRILLRIRDHRAKQWIPTYEFSFPLESFTLNP